MADICHTTLGTSGETLKQYLDARQSDALRIETLLSAMLTCLDRKELLFELIDATHNEAKALNRALDSVERPKGGAA